MLSSKMVVYGYYGVLTLTSCLPQYLRIWGWEIYRDSIPD